MVAVTGLDRLRAIAGAWDEWGLGGELAEIADEIERERAEDCYRMGLNYGTVWRVVADMERHILGHEGMEDSPVARWARELREALGGRADEEVEDVATVRADAMEAWRWVRRRGGLATLELHEETFADLMRQRDEYRDLARGYERDATWVREHGGLDAVIAVWENDVPLAEAVISELWPDGRPDECGNDIVMRELRRRLMPEGMERMLWDDGKPVTYDDAPDDVIGVYLALDGSGYVLMTDLPDQLMSEPGERVKRPALGAEGNRIEPAMDVWWVCEGDERGIHAERLHVESIGEDGLVTCYPFNGGTWVELEPSELYVNRPVLDADGVPIHKGDTVWCVATDEELTDMSIIRACWSKMREKLTVKSFFTDAHGDKWADFGGTLPCAKTCYLTHTKPEPPDSWERIEADCSKADIEYCDEHGLLDPSCNADEGEAAERHCIDCGCTCVEKMARDLVRRCREVAERERGE